jgi:hypothetical protein
MTDTTSDPLSNSAVRAIVEEIGRLVAGHERVTVDLDGIPRSIDDLFEALQSEDIGEPVARAVEEGLLTQVQAGDLLNIALWSGESNGAELRPTIERWLEEASDPIRVGVALEHETYPFRTLEAMFAVLSRVSGLYPQYAARIGQLIEERRQQNV